VLFDAAQLQRVLERLTVDLGVSGVDVSLIVDETTPVGRARVQSYDPVVLFVESGALEDPRHPRVLSESLALTTLGRLLARVADRRSGRYDDAPADGDLTLAQSIAWECANEGRLARLGYATQRGRWLYHFRNRHGFTDRADVAFDRLWRADAESWTELDRLSNDAQGAGTAA